MISTHDSKWKAIQKGYHFMLEAEEKEAAKEKKEDIENLEIDIDRKTLEKIIGKGTEKKTLGDYANDLFTRVRTIVKKAEHELDKMSFAKSALPDRELKKALRELSDKITDISIKLKKYNPEDIEDESEEKIIDLPEVPSKKEIVSEPISKEPKEDNLKNKDI